jgi:hypothetical protein
MLTEIMPVEVRTAGFSLAYSLATAVFGGFTPAICTYLINVTGNRAMPGVWMSCAAALGLIGAIIANPTQVVAQTNDRKRIDSGQCEGIDDLIGLSP